VDSVVISHFMTFRLDFTIHREMEFPIAVPLPLGHPKAHHVTRHSRVTREGRTQARAGGTTSGGRKDGVVAGKGP